jgi:hypothetical protein
MNYIQNNFLRMIATINVQIEYIERTFEYCKDDIYLTEQKAFLETLSERKADFEQQLQAYLESGYIDDKTELKLTTRRYEYK